jgi:hypothetical protein
MLHNHKTTDRPWQKIANEMNDQQNVGKLLQLAKELNQSMEHEEREKVRKRLSLDDLKQDPA